MSSSALASSSSTLAISTDGAIQALGPETSPQDLAAAAVCALEELPAEFRDAYARDEWGRQVARVLDALCDIANLIGGNPVIEQKARALVRARRIGEITV